MPVKLRAERKRQSERAHTRMRERQPRRWCLVCGSVGSRISAQDTSVCVTQVCDSSVCVSLVCDTGVCVTLVRDTSVTDTLVRDTSV